MYQLRKPTPYKHLPTNLHTFSFLNRCHTYLNLIAERSMFFCVTELSDGHAFFILLCAFLTSLLWCHHHINNTFCMLQVIVVFVIVGRCHCLSVLTLFLNIVIEKWSFNDIDDWADAWHSNVFTVYVKNIIFSFTTEHNKLIIGDVTVLK